MEMYENNLDMFVNEEQGGEIGTLTSLKSNN